MAEGTRVGTGFVEIRPDFSGFQELVGKRLTQSLSPRFKEVGRRAGKDLAAGIDRGGIGRSFAPLLRRFEKFGDEAGKAIASRVGRGATKAKTDMFGLADAIREVERRTKGASSASKSLESDMFGVGRAAKSSGKQIVGARASLRDWHREARAGAGGADRLRDRVRGLAAELRRSSREARASSGGFGGLNGGMARVNRGFSFFRNILRTIKWPVLIAGLGLSLQGLSAFTAGVVAATSAIGPLAGALVVLPAAAAAAAQAFGVLKLATAGIGDAVKAALDAEVEGGTQAIDVLRGQEDAAERVADAKRSLADTERQATFAAEDFKRAHEEARRELEDLRFAADEADDSLESAAVGLRRAKQELRRARSDPEGSALDVREAELSVEQAENSLRRIRVEAKRTREDYRDAQDAGVPAVVAAKQAEEDANRAVVDAERERERAIRDSADAMKEQGPAASALADKMAQLPPAAQAFVRVLVGLKPRLDALRATAAEGFFPGATKGLRGLLGNFSEVRTVVGETSEMFGRLAARAGKKFGSDIWGKDLLRIGRLNTKVLDRMGDAGLNLADAFRHILVSARPFLNWLSKGIVELSEWIKGEAEAGRESGRLAEFFDRTRETMELLGPILKGVGGALLGIGEAARPLGNEILKALGGSAEGWRKWTDSVAGKNDLKQYFAEAKPAIFEMGKLIGAVGKTFFELGKQQGVAHLLRLVRTELIPALTDMFGSVTGFASDFLEQFGTLRREGVPTFEAFLRTLADKAGEAGGKIVKALWNAFWGAGLWGKAAIGTFVLSKILPEGAVGRWGARMGKRLGAAMLGKFAPTIAAEMAAGSKLGEILSTRMYKLGKVGGRRFAVGVTVGLATLGFWLGQQIGKSLSEETRAGIRQWAVNAGENFVNALIWAINKGIDKINDSLDKLNVLGKLGVDAPNIGRVGRVDFEDGSEADVPKIDFEASVPKFDKAWSRYRNFNRAVREEAIRTHEVFRNHIGKMPGDAGRSGRGINSEMLPRLEHLADEGGRKGEAFNRRLSGSFRDLNTNVGSALKGILGSVRDALKILGVKGALTERFAVKHPEFVYGTGTTPNTAGKQRGGAVLPALATGGLASVVPGATTGDRHTLSLNGVPVAKVESKEGIFVGNRNLMAAMQRANDAVPRFQGGGLLKLQRGGYPMLSGDTDFLPALGFSLSKMARALGQAIFVTSGRRTYSEQAALYEQLGPGIAAPPGSSNHEDGAAGDIAPGREVFGGVVDNFGLGFPISHEPWHVELLNALMGARGGGGGVVPKLARALLQGSDGPLKDLGQAAMDKVWKSAQKLVDSQSSFGGFTGGGGPWQQVLQQIAEGRGWSAGDWMELVMRESGGDPSAVNPSSGAYGLGQFLGSTKDAYAKYGAASPSGVDQIRAMAKYIADRYGTPSAALSFHDANNWYKEGGLLKAPGLQAGGALSGGIAIGKRSFSEIKRKLSRVAGAGLGDGTLSTLTSLSGDVELFSEFADNAGALTLDTGEGEPILGVFQGGNEKQWLDQTLGSLLTLRNVLLEAQETIARQREMLIEQLRKAFERIKQVREKIGAEQERRGGLAERLRDVKEALGKAKGDKAKDALRGQVRDLVDRIGFLDLQQGERRELLRQYVSDVVPDLQGKRTELGTTLGELAGDGGSTEGGQGFLGLSMVQGKGGPLDKMMTAPPLGVLGGEIGSVLLRLRGLGLKPDAKAEDKDTEREGLLETLLREANQRTAISDAQRVALEGWDKLRQGIKGNFDLQLGGAVMPPFGGIAHEGAIVPGPAGAERTMVLKSGERVRTPEQEVELATAIRDIGGGSGAGSVSVTVNGSINQQPGDTRPAIEVRDSAGNLVNEVQATPGTGRKHPSAFSTRP